MANHLDWFTSKQGVFVKKMNNDLSMTVRSKGSSDLITRLLHHWIVTTDISMEYLQLFCEVQGKSAYQIKKIRIWKRQIVTVKRCIRRFIFLKGAKVKRTYIRSFTGTWNGKFQMIKKMHHLIEDTNTVMWSYSQTKLHWEGDQYEMTIQN